MVVKERRDVLPVGVAPKHIRKWLREVGGVTPWGENRYRLVLAESVMLYCGARWHDWPKGSDVMQQGGIEFEGKRTSKMVMRDPTNPSKEIVVEAEVPALAGISKQQPIRVVEEMRWIPRYSDIKGWLLQAWYPPTYYSPQHYKVTVTGRPDLPLLGEFPKQGEYERQFQHIERIDGVLDMVETFRTIPGQSWMERAIQSNERIMAERGNDPALTDAAKNLRMLKTLDEHRSARAAADRKERERFDAQIKDSISPIFSNTLEGGRIREELAQRCREKGIVLGHVGN